MFISSTNYISHLSFILMLWIVCSPRSFGCTDVHAEFSDSPPASSVKKVKVKIKTTPEDGQPPAITILSYGGNRIDPTKIDPQAIENAKLEFHWNKEAGKGAIVSGTSVGHFYMEDLVARYKAKVDPNISMLGASRLVKDGGNTTHNNSVLHCYVDGVKAATDYFDFEIE